MASFKNIALWGIGGDNIGGHILQALIKDGSYNLTVLARNSSKSTYPSTLKVIRVDDNLSHASLVNALYGQDVVISGVGRDGIHSQLPVAQAAIEAGVRRFIPSEWGFDNGDPLNAALNSIFKEKGEVAVQLGRLVDQHPDFSWTAIATGIWLDWTLDVKFGGIDAENHTVEYWDQGTHAPSMTTLPYAALAVLKVLEHPAEFKNQRVFMEAFAVTQRDIVAELEKQQGVIYSTTTIDGAAATKQAKDEMAANGFNWGSAMTTIQAEIWDPQYKADFVAASKQPLVETLGGLPKITLQDVVGEYIAKHK